MDALSKVYDPCCEERGISIVDMGLINSVVIDAAAASIELVLTSGWCPFSVRMLTQAREAVAAVPGLEDVDVDVTWDTTWDPSRMDPAARQSMQMLPNPEDVVDRDALIAQVQSTAPFTTNKEAVSS